ncbi:MAG: DUF5668 domain-containing protein [Cytophagales bacterium]|nr:DUF5668 domain-containing protein [Cytophagales bacterium]
METNDTSRSEEPGNRLQNNSGRVLGGIVLVVVGLAFFARQSGMDLPYWLFSWPMILIVIGLYIGGRRAFRLGGWVVLLVIGGVFLAEDVLYDFDMRHYLFPTIIVCVGLYMILKPRRGRKRSWDAATSSTEDAVEATSIFGSTRKNIISKDFKGGEITTLFGGTDLNFTQADIQGTAVIDITTAFGGTKLIVPSHWNLKSEVVCIFGGIDDKRQVMKEGVDNGKTLVLKGTCIFGGIDIKSF